jgi:hypothetical protein
MAVVETTQWWRHRCLELLDAQDWYGLYKTAMSWRTAGGGSYTPEAWLWDTCSALLHGQPKTAVHACDMALKVWVERPGDRAVLRFVRGAVIAHQVRDPMRALDDLAAATQGPDWLIPLASKEHSAATEAAERSKVRKPRVEPCPDFDLPYRELIHSSASAPLPEAREPSPTDGEQPATWDHTMTLILRR